LTDLKELIESGKVMPFTGETCTLAETPAAMSAIGAGHSRGQLIVRM